MSANLKKFLKEKRPNLSDGSINTYTSLLSSLYRKVYGEDAMDVEKFGETEKILEHLKDIAPPKRKTTLSALVVATGGNDAYRHQMLNDIGEYKQGIAQQEKSPAQQANWLSMEDIRNRWVELKRQADLLYKTNHHHPDVLQKIQNFVLLSVLGGIFTPPRRSLDWCAFKVNRIDPEHDNYLDTKKGQFVFNTYKTAKTYGQQREICPPELKKILSKFIALEPNRYTLFFDTNNGPLTSSKLNQRFVQIFGKKASVNQLRHSYLTSKFGDTIKQNQDIADTMKSMGSSPAQLQLYVKK